MVHRPSQPNQDRALGPRADGPPLATAPITRQQARLADAASWLEINLDALANNARQMDQHLIQTGQNTNRRPALLCAVVKKNAYGMGAVQVAHKLIRPVEKGGAGVHMLAVFSGEEALELIEQNVRCPIMLMMPFERLKRTDGLYRHAVSEQLHISIHDHDQLQHIAGIAQDFGTRLPLHLHLDTGMSRGGLQAQQMTDMLNNTKLTRFIRIAGIYTHLASSDTDPAFTANQLRDLIRFTSSHRDYLPQDTIVHAANTAACLQDPSWHLHMARIGIGLHGIGADAITDQSRVQHRPELVAPLTWHSHLIHTSVFPAGSPIGYHGTDRLSEDAPLGILPVGYGDGYPCGLRHGSIRLKPAEGDAIDCPTLGKVNMDQIVIDLRPAVQVGHSVESLKGCDAEVISADAGAPNSLANIAAAAGTHPYAILCGINARLPRKYVG